MKEDDSQSVRQISINQNARKSRQKAKKIDRQLEQKIGKLKNLEQKYVEQPQHPPQQPIEEKNPRKIVVVVGNMGHGKSSFIKMLVRQNQKQLIQCGVDVASVTKQIKIYQLDPQVEIKMNLNFKEPIYLMDTPGLDSKSGMLTLPIIEQITSILIRKKYQVISLIYIIKPPYRIVNQKGQSLFLEFHKLFPIKRSIKDKISLIALTHYDQFHIKKQKELNKYTQTLVSYLKQNQLKFHKNVLNWISEPTENPDDLKVKLGILMSEKHVNKWKRSYKNLSAEQYLKEHDMDYQDRLQLKQAYDMQFKILGKKINQHLELYYTYSLFQQGLVSQNNLMTRKIKKWIQAKDNIQPRMSTIVWYQFETFLENDNSLINTLKFAVGVTIFAKIRFSNKIGDQLLSKLYSFGKSHPVIALSLGLIGAAYGAYKLYKGFNRLQIKQLMRLTEKQIEQYIIKKTVMDAKQFYLLNIIDQIRRKSQKQQNVLIIQSSTSQWFKSATLIKPYEKKFTLKDVLKLEIDTKYEIQFEISLPSQDKLMKIIRECSLQVFYQDQN